MMANVAHASRPAPLGDFWEKFRGRSPRTISLYNPSNLRESPLYPPGMAKWEPMGERIVCAQQGCCPSAARCASSKSCKVLRKICRISGGLTRYSVDVQRRPSQRRWPDWFVWPHSVPAQFFSNIKCCSFLARRSLFLQPPVRLV